MEAGGLSSDVHLAEAHLRRRVYDPVRDSAYTELVHDEPPAEPPALSSNPFVPPTKMTRPKLLAWAPARRDFGEMRRVA